MTSFTRGKSSEDVYLQGKVSWVKHITPNQWDKWSLTLHPNAEGLERIRDLQAEGLKNVIKKDEDGYYCNFSRPCTKLMRGAVVGLTPPVVTDKDGQPMDGVAIGNGSAGTVKLEVYQHATPGGGKAKAARWVSLRIDDLIPFNPDTDYPEPQAQAVEGLKDQREHLF